VLLWLTTQQRYRVTLLASFHLVPCRSPHLLKPELTKMAAIHNWMKELKPHRTLFELCLPGSHDAGVYRDLRPQGHKEVNPGAKARCQDENIWEQAMRGSRVFDIRVFLAPDWSGIKKETPRQIPTMGHFFSETIHGRGGDYGGTLMSALRDAARFLKENNSEFLIFRIGHTQCTKEVTDVLQAFRKDDKYKDENDDYADHRKTVIHIGAKVNLASLSYQELRGKLVLVFDEKFRTLAAKQAKEDGSRDPFDSRNMAVYGYYPYDKYPDIPQIGLSFCGKYAGGVGDLAAFWKEERGNWTAASAGRLAHRACKEHQGYHGNSEKPLADRADHLLWVYWQETGGNILENTKSPQGMHARLGTFLKDISTKGELAMPNVIGHDFVTKETCAGIVKLNLDLKDTIFT
jgi:hypothetical protein